MFLPEEGLQKNAAQETLKILRRQKQTKKKKLRKKNKNKNKILKRSSLLKISHQIWSKMSALNFA